MTLYKFIITQFIVFIFLVFVNFRLFDWLLWSFVYSLISFNFWWVVFQEFISLLSDFSVGFLELKVLLTFILNANSLADQWFNSEFSILSDLRPRSFLLVYSLFLFSFLSPVSFSCSNKLHLVHDVISEKQQLEGRVVSKGDMASTIGDHFPLYCLLKRRSTTRWSSMLFDVSGGQ